MNIQILSDLHLEFHADGGNSFLASLDPKGVDVLVIAGDLCTGNLFYTALNILCERFPAVVLVLGNHCFYHTEPEAHWKRLKHIQDELWNLHILRDEVVEISGKRFAGTTLWFPFDVNNIKYQTDINDFDLIWGFVPWVYEENERALKFLDQELKADVIVTHHLPSSRCVAPEYKNSSLNRFFVCNVEDKIAKLRPKYWLFGHTHSSQDKKIEGVRVLCNPLGYPHELNPNFQQKLIVEV